MPSHRGGGTAYLLDARITPDEKEGPERGKREGGEKRGKVQKSKRGERAARVRFLEKTSTQKSGRFEWEGFAFVRQNDLKRGRGGRASREKGNRFPKGRESNA